jgi:hypothetical protein
MNLSSFLALLLLTEKVSMREVFILQDQMKGNIVPDNFIDLVTQIESILGRRLDFNHKLD